MGGEGVFDYWGEAGSRCGSGGSNRLLVGDGLRGGWLYLGDWLRARLARLVGLSDGWHGWLGGRSWLWGGWRGKRLGWAGLGLSEGRRGSSEIWVGGNGGELVDGGLGVVLGDLERLNGGMGGLHGATLSGLSRRDGGLLEGVSGVSLRVHRAP